MSPSIGQGPVRNDVDPFGSCPGPAIGQVDSIGHSAMDRGIAPTPELPATRLVRARKGDPCACCQAMLNYPRLMVAHSDAGVCRLLRRHFRSASYAVLTVQTGREALDLMRTAPSDLAILSTDLADIRGIEFIQLARGMTSAPIIASRRANGTLMPAKILDCGADDCVDEPFFLLELEARSRRLLRLMDAGQTPGVLIRMLGPLEMNPMGRKVRVDRKSVVLTENEFELLAVLIGTNGGILTDEEIIRKAWGPGYCGDRPRLRQTTTSLRNKIGDLILRAIQF